MDKEEKEIKMITKICKNPKCGERFTVSENLTNIQHYHSNYCKDHHVYNPKHRIGSHKKVGIKLPNSPKGKF